MGQSGLMAIQQLSDGRWRVDVEPVKGKRFRKTLKTKAEAMRFEATCRAKCSESNDWAPRPKDKRRLSELVELWFDLHASRSPMAFGVWRSCGRVQRRWAIR